MIEGDGPRMMPSTGARTSAGRGASARSASKRPAASGPTNGGRWRAGDYERVEAAIHFIDAHAREQPSLAEMAAAVGLSEHHFHRLFRHWAGITPKRFLQLLTLEHARRKLADSRSVLEASFRTGLSGSSRLHDLFVTLEGVTPGEHRSGGAGVEIRWGIAPTPFGTAMIAATDRGVCHMAFGNGAAIPRWATPETSPGAPPDLIRRWPAARLLRDDGTAVGITERIFRSESIPLQVDGTNFQVQVWQALVRIPPGTVASYSDVARGIGRTDAVRAVASAIASNEVAWLIPCHRVIRKLGETGGYRWGPARKRAMLAWEAARSG